MTEINKQVIIDYTNHRGESRKRRIIPRNLSGENNEFHPKTQYILYAFDYEKGDLRGFAMKDIHSWEPVDAP